MAFLEAVDAELESAEFLLVIGGAAASLAYGAIRTTTDIDTVGPTSSALNCAIEKARKNTGFNIPVTPVGIFDPPYSYEDRLQQVQARTLTWLTIKVPERHDLALMKVVRGEQHDLQVISEMHQSQPFIYETLAERFERMMVQIVGRPRMVALSFLAMVQQLFGPPELSDAQQRLDQYLDDKND